MNGFSILMFIFGFLIILCGLYLLRGRNGDFTQLLLWRSHKKHYPKEELRNIGKWTIIAGLIPIILGIIGLFLDIY